MKIKELLRENNNVIQAAERFRKKPQVVDKRNSGMYDHVYGEISNALQWRWNKKFFHTILDQASHAEDDYVTRLYLHLPLDNEEWSSANKIAYTLFQNNKDLILKSLEQEREVLNQLHQKYKGVIIFTKVINDYIVACDMLLDGLSHFSS